MAVIYEVTVAANAGIADAYLAWLRAHVTQLLALPGFESATIDALVEDEAMQPTERGWCVRYRLRDRAALDAYLRDHAANARADGIMRFGDGFRARRRVLEPLDA